MAVIRIGCRSLPTQSRPDDIINEHGDRGWRNYGNTIAWLDNEAVGERIKIFSWVSDSVTVS